MNQDDCILWTGAISEGYGQSTFYGKTERAHRVAWRSAWGDIPDGMHVHHRCHNRLCVNIDHLELIDARYHGWLHNQRRGVTHCPKGHEYTSENTVIRRGKHRQCRECDRERARAYYLAHREERIAYAAAYKKAKRG